MYAFKQAVGTLLAPLPVAALLVLLGVLLRALGRRRAGTVLIALGAITAFGASVSPVANLLIRPLESRYPAVLEAAAISPAPKYVIVLGAGYHPRPDIPVTSALTSTGVVRLSEGLRLFRQLPGARLIVSGGAPENWGVTAEGYARLAVALGAPPDSIVKSDTPLDTAAEIRALRAMVGEAPVLVVTSAAHMPRAMALCAHFKVHAIAAPTDRLVSDVGSWTPASLIPSGLSLRKTETALHEYLGLLALELGVT